MRFSVELEEVEIFSHLKLPNTTTLHWNIRAAISIRVSGIISCRSNLGDTLLQTDACRNVMLSAYSYHSACQKK